MLATMLLGNNPSATVQTFTPNRPDHPFTNRIGLHRQLRRMITVLRSNFRYARVHRFHDITTHSSRTPQENIHDAAPLTPTARAQARPPPIDVGIQASEVSPIPSEDPAHRVPGRCEDAPD